MEDINKTKILYIGSIPPAVGGQSAGGIATHLWDLAAQAKRNDYEVYVLTYAVSSFVRNGIRIISFRNKMNKLFKLLLGMKNYLANRDKLRSLDFCTFKEKLIISFKIYQLRRILDEVKPDLIHVLDILDSTIFCFRALEDCPPITVTEHGTGIIYKYNMHKVFNVKGKRLFLRRVEEAVRRVDHVISVSNFSMSSFLDTFVVPSHVKIKAILNPVNVNKIPLLDKEKIKKGMGLGNKKIIYFCGGWHAIERKGLDILLRSVNANAFLKKNSKIIVITNKEAKNYAQNFIISNGLDGLILGYQPHEMLIKFFNVADIFVMPSKQEGIGLVYYEALLAGVPIVGFLKSLEELEKVLGVYIGERFDANKENEKALAEKIIKVLNTDFDRELLRRKVIDNLSWNVKFNEFEKLYKELLVYT